MHLETWFLYNLGSLVALMGYLKYYVRIVANLLWNSLCLFDTIVELHATHGRKKIVQSHPHRNVKMNFCSFKGLFISL